MQAKPHVCQLPGQRCAKRRRRASLRNLSNDSLSFEKFDVGVKQRELLLNNGK